MAYRWAAELEAGLGLPAMSDVYKARENQLRETAQKLYWDAGRRLYADTPARQKFSQHANTMAVLADAIAGNTARDLMLRTLKEPGLAQASVFFRFYVHRALATVGEGDGYLDRLGDWRDMLARGLTTFAEVVDRSGNPSRSDCHAWSASPNVEIFRTVLGLDSAAPGFRRVTVKPHLGKLTGVKGTVPHPAGNVEVNLEPAGDAWNVSVSLPAAVTGEFLWRGYRRELAAGANRFTVGA
jgi:alpha-L-rhamnosidase